MPRDEDPELSAAFADLHRRQSERAPAFGLMRARAVRAAQNSRRFREGWLAPIALAGAVSVAIACWFMSAANPPAQRLNQAGSEQQVEQLLTAIELHADTYFPDYPTDLLLTPNQP